MGARPLGLNARTSERARKVRECPLGRGRAIVRRCKTRIIVRVEGVRSAERALAPEFCARTAQPDHGRP